MPVITTNFSDPSSIEMANISGVIHVILNISWTEQADVDHYMIQIDSHPQVLIQNTFYVAVCESFFDTSHTVRLTAVDVCDQTSETAVVNNIVLEESGTKPQIVAIVDNRCTYNWTVWGTLDGWGTPFPYPQNTLQV